MNQQEAMNMSNEQAAQILIPMRNMMCDQNGCPISDAVFALDKAIESLSAEAVSREEYEETDGVIKIKKQSAKDVGEIKHIVVCSANYTRYFYNDSMPIQHKGGNR